MKSHFKKSNVQIDLLKWERIIPPNDTDLIVNTTSHGMKKDEIIELDISNLNKKCLFVDIIYKPQITETMEFFKKNGFRTLNGLGMLVYQAAISFNMWFGITLTKIDIEQALGICEKKKYKIAITGRIGSGKSTLSKILIDLGYSVFESDYVVNKILNQKDFD